jgi:hypothetical protein
MQSLCPAIQGHVMETNTHTTTTIKIQIMEFHNHNSTFFILNIEDLKPLEIFTSQSRV